MGGVAPVPTVTGAGRGVLGDVEVGPFRVRDAGQDAVVDEIVGYGERREQCVALALHVGGLLERDDEAFVRAFDAADVRYADGASVVMLARAGGAARIERAPTTDLGHDVLDALRARLGRAPRLALLGGPAGLAELAGRALAEQHDLDVVHTQSGYGFRSDTVVEELAAARPDVVLVGLGMPFEATWVDEHRAKLPSAIILTCGGWFGFLAGLEHRAPRRVQALSLEWVWRLAQQPRRLGRRYAQGALVTALLGGRTLVDRMGRAPAGARR
jgi:N-acetylglucosaminyldiphosphoundecaprenol N-acetyl-beta-D-mannosaminyltransferase